MSKTVSSKSAKSGLVKKSVAPGCCGGRCSTKAKSGKSLGKLVAAPVKLTFWQRVLAVLGLR